MTGTAVAEFQVAFTTAARAESRNKGRESKIARRARNAVILGIGMGASVKDVLAGAAGSVTLRRPPLSPDKRIRHENETVCRIILLASV